MKNYPTQTSEEANKKEVSESTSLFEEQEAHAHEFPPKQASLHQKAVAHILRHAERVTQSLQMLGSELSLKEL